MNVYGSLNYWLRELIGLTKNDFCREKRTAHDKS